ncbi:hypothetical protein I352_02597 [Cryptococcus deuterogattii MMRL2647]|nr:hypothetical protein I352_02597 [Cryptococcus deuterogattii MMRL2647]
MSRSNCALVNCHLCCQHPLQDIQRCSRLFPRVQGIFGHQRTIIRLPYRTFPRLG